jgi:hypothetical protein
MKHYSPISHRYLVFITVFCAAVLLALPTIISAQETATPEGTPIEISGVVSQISTGTITVAGLTVEISGATLDANITVGTTVTVTGHMLPTNVVVAQVVIIIIPGVTSTPEATSEATPEATVEVTPEVTPPATPTGNPNVVIVIEGPVVNIVTNIITIYNFNIEVEPTNPILTIIEIGDVIRVEGAFGGSGIIIASVVSNVSTITTVDTGATVSLDGPIEAINGNIVIVNGISVQFAPNDPQLATLHVGDFLNVQGNFVGSGTTIVLVVINITIINNIVVDENPYCWFHVNGMGMGMGHWHCDGMGMGMGMGMGEDGMGMGG